MILGNAEVCNVLHYSNTMYHLLAIRFLYPDFVEIVMELNILFLMQIVSVEI